MSPARRRQSSGARERAGAPPARSSMVQRLWASRLLRHRKAQLLLVNLLTFGLEVCLAAGITYVPPLLLEVGVEEKFMTMVLGESPRPQPLLLQRQASRGRKTPVSLPSRCLLPLSRGSALLSRGLTPHQGAPRERGGQGCSLVTSVSQAPTHIRPPETRRNCPLQFKPVASSNSCSNALRLPISQRRQWRLMRG